MSTNDREGNHQSDNPHPDVSIVNRYLLNYKSNCNIFTWNVQTMYSTSKTAQIIKEMENYKLYILGIKVDHMGMKMINKFPAGARKTC